MAVSYLGPFSITPIVWTRVWHTFQSLTFFIRARECCLLVLNSVTSPPQWICKPEPRDMHDVCVFIYVWSEVLRPFIPSSNSAFSLRLMPLRLVVGATPTSINSSDSPLPLLTAAQRVHSPHLRSLLRPPLNESRFHDSITVRPCLPHTYMSKQTCSRPLQLPCPLPCSPSHPFVRNRTVAPSSVPQLVVLRVSCEWSPACSQGLPMPSCFC